MVNVSFCRPVAEMYLKILRVRGCIKVEKRCYRIHLFFGLIRVSDDLNVCIKFTRAPGLILHTYHHYLIIFIYLSPLSFTYVLLLLFSRCY